MSMMRCRIPAQPTRSSPSTSSDTRKGQLDDADGVDAGSYDNGPAEAATSIA
jgi:hypothetical protein